jgi:hypothetical protein
VWNRHRTLQNLINSPESITNLIDAAIRNLSTNSSSTADYLHQITIYIHICHHHRPSFFNRLIAAISADSGILVWPSNGS